MYRSPLEQNLPATHGNQEPEKQESCRHEKGTRKPDHFLDAAGGTGAETVGKVIAAVDAVLEKEKPEALLILGDTNSSLAAIIAKRMAIPVFHMEAGNRCFGKPLYRMQRMPTCMQVCQRKCSREQQTRGCGADKGDVIRK